MKSRPHPSRVKQQRTAVKARQQQRKTLAVALIVTGAVVAGVAAWILLATDAKVRRLQAQVTELKGEVTIRLPDGSQREAELGEVLDLGMMLQTTDGAEVDVGFPNLGGMKLDGETWLEFQRLDTTDDAGHEVELSVRKGRVFHRVHTMGKRAEFKLTTPSGQMVVRGTEFFIEVDDQGSNLVATREGEVAVASAREPDEEMPVMAGMMASVTPAQVNPVEPVGPREEELFARIDEIEESIELPPGFGRSAVPLPVEDHVILADGRQQATPWRYTLNAPPSDWTESDFDDSQWREGVAAFGTDLYLDEVRTRWPGRKIWARTEFELTEIPDVARMTVNHNDGATVYLNGVEIQNFQGWSSKQYRDLLLGDEARSALRPGRNVLAAHGFIVYVGSYLDAGLREVTPYPIPPSLASRSEGYPERSALFERLRLTYSFDDIRAIKDGSGRENHGTPEEGPVPPVVVGKRGGAADYRPFGARTQSADSVGITGDAPRTFCAWVKPVTYPKNGNALLYTWGDEGHNGARHAILMRPTGKLWHHGRNRDHEFSEAELPLDQWTHLAVTYDASKMVVHLDGVPRGERTIRLETNDTPLTLGRYSGLSFYRQWSGLLDEVMIFDKALDEDEIQEVMEWTSRL